MNAPAKLLAALSGLERALCALGFLIMTLALGADVGARLWSRWLAQATGAGWLDPALADRFSAGGGILGASQVAVIGMMLTALFGMGLSAGQGAELRATVLDRAWPKGWSSAVDRISDGLAALMLAAVAALCAVMAAQSLRLGDVSSVLRMPIWPLQAAVALAFAFAAARYALYGAFPALRPRRDAVPDTPQREEEPA